MKATQLIISNCFRSINKILLVLVTAARLTYFFSLIVILQED